MLFLGRNSLWYSFYARRSSSNRKKNLCGKPEAIRQLLQQLNKKGMNISGKEAGSEDNAEKEYLKFTNSESDHDFVPDGAES